MGFQTIEYYTYSSFQTLRTQGIIEACVPCKKTRTKIEKLQTLRKLLQGIVFKCVKGRKTRVVVI